MILLLRLVAATFRLGEDQSSGRDLRFARVSRSRCYLEVISVGWRLSYDLL